MIKILLGALVMVIFVLVVVNFLVWPNTYLGQTKISFQTRSQIREFVEETLNKPIKINLDRKEVEMNYSDLDIKGSIERTLAPIEEIGFGQRLRKWLLASGEPTLVYPALEFGPNFKDLTQKMLEPIELEETAVFDKDKIAFDYISKERVKKIDSEEVRRRLITGFGQLQTIELTSVELKSELEKGTEQKNALINKVLSKPVEIMIKRNGKSKLLSLDRTDFSGLLNAVGITTSLKVDRDKLARVLLEKTGMIIPAIYVSGQIERELLARETTSIRSPVVLGEDDGPNSTGVEANKYIEIDVSQQKMYLFGGGDLLKTYSVSTGLNYPTPAGRYKIINKSPMGYSGIFNVFMPYWMAFNYAQDIGAYLGIHELPYKLKDGERYYRFGNYIGQKKTGGCVALAPGDSKEVYDFSFPNMDVLIYD